MYMCFYILVCIYSHKYILILTSHYICLYIYICL